MSIILFKDEYHFLSNFFKSKIVLQRKVYRTAEHMYQAAKSLDPDEQADVRNCYTPGQSKRAGQRVTLRADWDSIKDQVMMYVVFHKFDQSEALTNKLEQTGKEEIIEGNYWHDNYWGGCVCKRCSKIHGENKLGKILMKIRQVNRLVKELL